jgi:hypothetical protein
VLVHILVQRSQGEVVVVVVVAVDQTKEKEDHKFGG